MFGQGTRRLKDARWRCFAVAAAATLGMASAAGCDTAKRLTTTEPTPGTTAHPLTLGRSHVFDWGDGGRKVEATPLRVERGSISDLADDFDLTAADKKETPFYVRFRFRNAGTAPIEATEFDGSSHVALRDTAGKPLKALLLINVFGGGNLPCATKKSTANWPAGASLESCTIFFGDPGVTPASMAYSVPVISGLVDSRALVWWKVTVG